MAYIGREPQVGNFQVCDAISVVNGQAAYTMQVSGVNVSPETANHMIVSLNGIIQAPGSSYTVSGSTITFASNLVTGDVINFIHILGSVLDLGVPSDSTVSLAKLTATGTKDATTFLRGDNTFAEAGGANTPNFLVRRSSDQSISDATGTKVQFNSEVYDSASAFDSSSNYRFTVPSGQAGKYYFYGTLTISSEGDSTNVNSIVYIYKNNSIIAQYENNNSDNNPRTQVIPYTYSESLSVGDYIEVYGYCNTSNNASPAIVGNSTRHKSTFGGYKIIE